MLPLPEEKRRIIEKRILREVTQFQEQHGEGLRMQILSAKYSRACNEIGGFPELIASMETARLIVVTYDGNGARTVTLPPSSRIVMRDSGAKGEPWF